MDIAHAYTDEELQKLERKFRKIYRQAADEMYEKLEIYLNSLAAKDAAMLTKLSNGKITSKQYQAWRAQQILVGEQMETIAADLAKSCTDANIMALKALNADLSDVFAENANYIMYAAEMVTGENYAFTLYNQNAVNRLIKDNPQLLPKPRVKIAKDRKWNKRVITSAVTQGILQGESMQNIAKRMHGEVSKGITVESIKNANRMTAEQVAKAVERRIMVAAMRTARTAVTGAENAGRLQGYKDLQSNGVDIKKQWVATLDNRTRHEHRMLDGQIREIGEPFEVDGYKLDFPADPKGEAHLVYNCRCTTISVINGHEIDIDVRDKSAIGDYEEWKNGKKEDAEAAEPIPPKKRLSEIDKEIKKWEKFSDDSSDFNDWVKSEAEIEKLRKERLSVEKQIEEQRKEEAVARMKDKGFFDNGNYFIAQFETANISADNIEVVEKSFESVFTKFPQLKGKFAGIGTWDSTNPKNAMASTSRYGGQIQFNPSYWKDGNISSSVKRLFNGNFLATETVQGTVVHEIGHAVDSLLGNRWDVNGIDVLYKGKQKMASHQIMAQVYKKAGIKRDDVAKYVSLYSSYSDAEAFAECFTAWMNKSKKNKVIDAFGEILEDIMKGVK